MELFVIPDCPYATLAETLLRVTLNELGLPSVPVLTTVIDTHAEAIRRGFMGSPSIEINGIDPWAQPDGKPALACRLYPSSTGLPTQYSLAQALCAAVLNEPSPSAVRSIGDSFGESAPKRSSTGTS
ncbi:hypothetical protein [Mycolicibacterium grossiae]|uniref:hypothetical protein n=1 Tax=Mycolicibacterium grossiae TaxID=1552759 RepID=UPI00159F5AAE|nr:hypothetical protein [Mycolicibacterium grossiae]